MTKEEIKSLISAKIAGQGNQVDSGGALDEILNEIVDAIPEGGGDVKNTIIPKYTEITNPTVGQLAYVPGREEPGEGEEEAAIIFPRLLIYCEDAESSSWYSVQLDLYE